MPSTNRSGSSRQDRRVDVDDVGRRLVEFHQRLERLRCSGLPACAWDLMADASRRRPASRRRVPIAQLRRNAQLSFPRRIPRIEQAERGDGQDRSARQDACRTDRSMRQRLRFVFMPPLRLDPRRGHRIVVSVSAGGVASFSDPERSQIRRFGLCKATRATLRVAAVSYSSPCVRERCFMLSPQWLRGVGCAFLYWIVFLLALEPGNVQHALSMGHALDFDDEALRICARHCWVARLRR